MTRRDFDELQEDVLTVAPRLLGSLFMRTTPAGEIVGRIVEVEAYDQADAASHSYNGETPRTSVMFGPAGFLYVYFTYGMHYCMNVVTGPVGHGSAVLIRALEPVKGIDLIRLRRAGKPDHELTNGPAKLCQALEVTRSLNGHDLQQSPLELKLQPSLTPDKIVQTTRIGISRAQHEPWRFYIKDSPYISKP